VQEKAIFFSHCPFLLKLPQVPDVVTLAEISKANGTSRFLMRLPSSRDKVFEGLGGYRSPALSYFIQSWSLSSLEADQSHRFGRLSGKSFPH
jgi:hypothetical protein